jgi:ligand-binding sensor domain-containing protein
LTPPSPPVSALRRLALCALLAPLLSPLLCTAPARAEDAWSRPEQLRAVRAPPERWADLRREARPVRLYWDEGGPPADIEQIDARGSRLVAESARPGWQSAAVERDVRFRVRLGPSGRWSEPVSPDPWSSPADLARLAAGGQAAILAEDVGQIVADPTSGGAWASSLGGGLVALEAKGEGLRVLTRWDGLPDDRAISVDTDGQRVLVGTARGAALLEGGRVVRVWDDALSDPYVQSVLLDGPRLWLGTFHGLDRVTGGQIEAILAPWSVFSLSQALNGQLWVGYQGVQRIPKDAPPVTKPVLGPAAPEPEPEPGPGWLAEDNVYGLLDGGDTVWLAGQKSGLFTVSGEGAPIAAPDYPRAAAYSVAAQGGGLYVASGAYGLLGPDRTPWGEVDGMPGSSIWSVAAEPGGGLWVAGDDGAALVLLPDPAAPREPGRRVRPRAVRLYPLSPWPAATHAEALWLTPKGAFLAGAEGVRSIGAPHRWAANLVVAAGAEVHALQEDADGSLWALGRRAIRLDRKGHLHQVALPSTVWTAAESGGRLWVGGDDGLWFYDPDGDRFLPGANLDDVTRVRAGGLGLWAISRRLVFQVVAGGARPYLRAHPALDLAPVEGAVWLGTTEGLERLIVGGPRDGEVEDSLGKSDAGVEVPAVADDGAGGCWFAAEDGTVGRVTASGEQGSVHLPGPNPPRPKAIVAEGVDAAWILTEAGTWRVEVEIGVHRP